MNDTLKLAYEAARQDLNCAILDIWQLLPGNPEEKPVQERFNAAMAGLNEILLRLSEELDKSQEQAERYRIGLNEAQETLKKQAAELRNKYDKIDQTEKLLGATAKALQEMEVAKLEAQKTAEKADQLSGLKKRHIQLIYANMPNLIKALAFVVGYMKSELSTSIKNADNVHRAAYCLQNEGEDLLTFWHLKHTIEEIEREL